ncbi:carbohydrate ABC transporter permease [Oscillospiraceae bacterium DSM 107454]|uniref:Carbohydrate ABC transporter permease n=2 Tax=Ructibacterium gallinarum TaxID=2779355 RepID=A0A9D5RCE8_9FIRM|nr:carbohydrate ABC transporter permease [Ructibacterium gallinarum]
MTSAAVPVKDSKKPVFASVKHEKKKRQLGLHLLFMVLCILFIVPFLLVLSISFSNERDIIMTGYSFIPKHFDLAAYQYVFQNPQSVLNAYKVTAFNTVVATALSVFIMSMVAYPLSKKRLKGRVAINFFIFFTMLFNGGMVPTYIVITQYLHLDNKIWVYILPYLVNAWHIFLLRSFFSTLPEEIFESALMDGASEFRIFLSFVLPLSKPGLATVTLFCALERWNDWMTSMLYVSKENLITLQYMLQRILINIQFLQEHSNNAAAAKLASEIPSETVRMALAVVAAGPMLLVFPFFQKYFVKGLTIGAVKG